ncbi:hypothetical protein GCM10025779_23430 [Arthrobacter cryoconiti]
MPFAAWGLTLDALTASVAFSFPSGFNALDTEGAAKEIGTSEAAVTADSLAEASRGWLGFAANDAAEGTVTASASPVTASASPNFWPAPLATERRSI